MDKKHTHVCPDCYESWKCSKAATGGCRLEKVEQCRSCWLSFAERFHYLGDPPRAA